MKKTPWRGWMGGWMDGWKIEKDAVLGG